MKRLFTSIKAAALVILCFLSACGRKDSESTLHDSRSEPKITPDVSNTPSQTHPDLSEVKLADKSSDGLAGAANHTQTGVHTNGQAVRARPEAKGGALPEKTGDYTNTLGMRFVPVPGTGVRMCIHETRNKDYAAFHSENAAVGSKWKNVQFRIGFKKIGLTNDENHPVVEISWEDADAFCKWLTKKEGRKYRLPTDYEWSCAVGIGANEDPKAAIESKEGAAPGFPWGAIYPPPTDNIGNYADMSASEQSNQEIPVKDEYGDLSQYRDGHLLTAPVMSYPPNLHGIHDLGGNVWEWCSDLTTNPNNPRVLRGGSWTDYDPRYIKSSHRLFQPSFRYNVFGFRCVIED